MSKVIQYSNKGSREVNQDYISWLNLSESSSIYVLADGMGGYSYGDIAAKTVADSIIEYVALNIQNYTSAELLKEAVIYANDCLMLKKLSLSAKQMGSVIVVMLLIGNEAFITWLGDSRLYMFRNHQEVYRTTDHSVINELSKINTLRGLDFEKYSNIVTKSVMGTDKVDEIEIKKVKTNPGDVFVMCSDGIHKQYSVSKIVEDCDSSLEDMNDFSKVANDNISFIRIEI